MRCIHLVKLQRFNLLPLQVYEYTWNTCTVHIELLKRRRITSVNLSQAEGHKRVDLLTIDGLRFHLLLHLLRQARLQALFKLLTKITKRKQKKSWFFTEAKLLRRPAFILRWRAKRARWRLVEGFSFQLNLLLMHRWNLRRLSQMQQKYLDQRQIYQYQGQNAGTKLWSTI